MRFLEAMLILDHAMLRGHIPEWYGYDSGLGGLPMRGCLKCVKRGRGERIARPVLVRSGV